MTGLPLPALGVLAGLLCAAAVWDVGLRRIPNLLTLATALAGLMVRAYVGGWRGVLSGLAAGIVVLVVLAPQWARRRVGGGDVKLATGAAVWVGLGGLLAYALAGAVAGGLLALLCWALSSREVRRAVRANLGQALLLKGMPQAPLEAEGRIAVPYGIAAGAGALVALALMM
jgi:prepilin peptidase CpaA